MTAQNAGAGSIGAGQQVPQDSDSEFTVANFIVRQIMAELETMTPVQVVAVHPGQGTPPKAGTVDVQLLVSLLDGAGNAVQQGIVSGVPYFRLQGGQWAIVCDPAVKDFGYIVSASRDISNVVKSPGIANPASYRKYSFSDSIYMGGCFNAVPVAWVWCKSDGTLNIQDAKGNTLSSSASGWALGGNLAVTGSITATQEITRGFGGADQVTVGQHTHTGTDTHGDTLEINPPTAGT